MNFIEQKVERLNHPYSDELITLKITTNLDGANRLFGVGKATKVTILQEGIHIQDVTKNNKKTKELSFICAKSNLNKEYDLRTDKIVPIDKDDRWATKCTDFARKSIYSRVEDYYFELLGAGEKPEIVNGILPLDTATTMILNATRENYDKLLETIVYDRDDKQSLIYELVELIKQAL